VHGDLGGKASIIYHFKFTIYHFDFTFIEKSLNCGNMISNAEGA